MSTKSKKQTVSLALTSVAIPEVAPVETIVVVEPVTIPVPPKVAKVAKAKRITLLSPELKPMKTLPTTYPAWVKDGLAIPFFQSEPTTFSYLSMYLLTRELAPDFQDRTVDELVNLLVLWATAHPDTVVGKVLKNMSNNRFKDVRSHLQWLSVDVLYRYDNWLATQPVAEPVAEPVTEDREDGPVNEQDMLGYDGTPNFSPSI